MNAHKLFLILFITLFLAKPSMASFVMTSDIDVMCIPEGNIATCTFYNIFSYTVQCSGKITITNYLGHKRKQQFLNKVISSGRSSTIEIKILESDRPIDDVTAFIRSCRKF